MKTVRFAWFRPFRSRTLCGDWRDRDIKVREARFELEMWLMLNGAR